MSSPIRAAGVLLGLLLSFSARADRDEKYVVIGFDPGVTRYELGQTGSGAATKPSGTLTATGYYGLTNTWHVGVRLRVSKTTNLRISNASVPLNGLGTAGDVYEDHLGLGLDAVVLYRLNTHHAIEPLLELAAGVTSHQFSRVAFIPRNSTYSYSRPGVSQVALHGAAALLVEYRFATRWVAAVGVSAERETGDVPASFTVPLRLGTIW